MQLCVSGAFLRQTQRWPAQRARLTRAPSKSDARYRIKGEAKMKTSLGVSLA
ncbi:uncharacterized protein METZ01_LOCUS140728, partial [marine metagenome]